MAPLKGLFSRFQDKEAKARKQLKEMHVACNEESLLKAAESGHSQAVGLLLEAGMNPNAKDAQSRTPAVLAAINGHGPVIRALAAGGANLNQPDREGHSALVHAIHNAQMDCARVLIDSGANVDVRDNGGFTAAMLAVRAGHYSILEALINAGADVNVKNHESGQTALMMAAARGSIDMTELLLKNAITSEDRDAQDRKGATALLYAVRGGHSDLVRLFCSKKADVNLADKDGITPLKAAEANPAITKILLDSGARSHRGDAEIAEKN